MGKGKLRKWDENKSFPHVFEPNLKDIVGGDTFMQGLWRRDFFKNDNPIVVELGCGKGEYSVGMAELFPEKNFVGVDVKGHRFWRGAKTAHEKELSNVAFLRARIEFIQNYFGANEVDEIWLTFSDPQPKDEKGSRKLTGPPFIDRYRKFAKPDALINIKTDNTHLYEWTMEALPGCGCEILDHSADVYGNWLNGLSPIDQKVMSIRTHYEKIFSEKGSKIKFIKARL
jgi:tRNA (guanine-N7-)-methyltransferase